MSIKTNKSLHLDTAQPATRRRLYKAIRALQSGEYAVELIRKRWKVSDAQRAYYWGYLVVEVGRLIGKNSDQTDRVLNSLFLHEPWTIGGEVVTIVKSLSDLEPVSASIYFESITIWVWDKYRVRLTEPDPAKRKAKFCTLSFIGK